MKYSDETIEAVSDSTGLSEGQLRYIYIYSENSNPPTSRRLCGPRGLRLKSCAPITPTSENR